MAAGVDVVVVVVIVVVVVAVVVVVVVVVVEIVVVVVVVLGVGCRCIVYPIMSLIITSPRHLVPRCYEAKVGSTLTRRTRSRGPSASLRCSSGAPCWRVSMLSD